LRPPRILCIAHEVTLTGSPMNLLHFQQWLVDQVGAEVHTLALAPGALQHRFEQVGGFTLVDRHAPGALLGTVQAGLQHLGSSRAWKPVAAARLVPQLRKLRGFDLVYCNSLPSIAAVPYLPERPPVVAHAHELQVAYRTWRNDRDRQLFHDVPERWIAASGAVRDLLVDEVGLPAARVLLHYEFIDAYAVAARKIGLREVEARRRELRIPSDAAVVVGAGTVDWRKGADLFVQLACEVRRIQREPVHFIWVGGDLRSVDWERIRSDRDRAGADHVHFVGVKPDPFPWFQMADAFALTSREDPFPLVVLECAAMGKPIVTYRNGGIPELLEAAGPAAAAGIADHLDVGALARKVDDLLTIDRLRRQAGDEVRRRVLSCHDLSVAAPALWADLEAVIAGQGAGGDIGR
jgi:glycosyltransferase involved in cell wall biosynthesis